MIKKKFITPPTAIASYSYTDIAEGTGVQIFYGASHKEQTTTAYYLSSNKSYSNDIVTLSASHDTTTATKLLDIDFDVIFNMPKTIKGKIRATITLGVTRSNAEQHNSETYAIIKARHWDGTTETELANAQTETMTSTVTGANVPYSEVKNVEIDVATAKHFKRDETLRITVEIWGKKTGTTASKYSFGHDPMDRNDEETEKSIEDTDTTMFIVNVPFVLNL